MTRDVAPVNRALPAESNVVLGTVAEPEVREGKDARVALAETRSALREANGRLAKSRQIYRGVRQQYGGK